MRRKTLVSDTCSPCATDVDHQKSVAIRVTSSGTFEIVIREPSKISESRGSLLSVATGESPMDVKESPRGFPKRASRMHLRMLPRMRRQL